MEQLGVRAIFTANWPEMLRNEKRIQYFPAEVTTEHRKLLGICCSAAPTRQISKPERSFSKSVISFAAKIWRDNHTFPDSTATQKAAKEEGDARGNNGYEQRYRNTFTFRRERIPRAVSDIPANRNLRKTDNSRGKRDVSIYRKRKKKKTGT